MTAISGQTKKKMKEITLSGPHRKWIEEISLVNCDQVERYGLPALAMTNTAE